MGGEHYARPVLAFVESTALPTKDSAHHRDRQVYVWQQDGERGQGWLSKKELPKRIESKQGSNWILPYIGESSVF